MCRDKKQFYGIRDCIRKTVKSSGIIGLYSGLWAALIREIIYRGSKYGLYDSLKVIKLEL